MSQKKLHYFAFYSVTITLVLILFRFISAYGEKNLKVPPSINGSYRLKLQQLPQCFTENKVKVTLNIEQSGVYLFSKLTWTSETRRKVEIPLEGTMQQQQFFLTGKTSYLRECSNKQKNILKDTVTIKGQQNPQDNDSIAGYLTWEPLVVKIDFTGELETQRNAPKSTQ